MIIVKVGGGEGIEYDLLCDDLAQLLAQGQQLLLIHGGSHLTAIDVLADALKML